RILANGGRVLNVSALGQTGGEAARRAYAAVDPIPRGGRLLPPRHRLPGGRARSGGAPMKTFGLALGGGGARGLAHISVLEAIDDLNLRPGADARTSVGGMIGAASAAGSTSMTL